MRLEGASLETAKEPAASAAALTALIADERSRGLWDAMAALPPAERTALILYYLDEMAVRDIARALGVTIGTIKTLLFRGRRHLRERLDTATMSHGVIDMTCAHVLGLIDARTFCGLSARTVGRRMAACP
jgi:DNA-directed RNA polymerase specialized sigma24 family protein